LSEIEQSNAPEGRFADLYDNAPCGYLVISQSGHIQIANRTVSRWLDHEPGELVGKRLVDVLTLGGKVFWETHVRPLLRMQGVVEGVALDFLKRDGATVLAFGTATEIRGVTDEDFETRLAIFKAAERRQFEQRLLGARQRAEQANMAIMEGSRLAQESLRSERETAELREQFIAVLGHDLRNPLAGLLGGVRLLARENLSERAQRLIPLMIGSGARMSELIDNVMDFAQARLGGGISLERNSDQPLGSTILQVVEELRTIHPERVIQVDLAIEEPVNCDRSRIAQLVSNLLGNAVTHGALELPIRLIARTTRDSVEIMISNGGAEIPPEAMDKLFQPFFRGEVRPSQQGLGLGLHIASEIAKAHGGTITVSSSEVETCFTFQMRRA